MSPQRYYHGQVASSSAMLPPPLRAPLKPSDNMLSLYKASKNIHMASDRTDTVITASKGYASYQPAVPGLSDSKTGQKRRHNDSDAEMPDSSRVRFTNPKATIKNPYNASLWSKRSDALVQRGQTAQQYLPQSLHVRTVQASIDVLRKASIRQEDLNAFIGQQLGPDAQRLIAENWNVISGFIYAPIYRKDYGTKTVTEICVTNRERAIAGAIGSARIFQHLSDNKVAATDLSRNDTAYGQQIVKHRRIVIHSVHDDDMYAIYETGFGQRQQHPDKAGVRNQYAYAIHENRIARILKPGIPQLRFSSSRAQTKDGYFHIARGIFLPLSVPVAWEGSLLSDDMPKFAEAVGTIGHVTPAQVIENHAEGLKRLGKDPANLARRAERFGLASTTD